MIKLYSLLAACLLGLSVRAQSSLPAPEIGVVVDMERDSLVKALQFKYMLETTAKVLSPREVSDAEFQERLQQIRELEVPLYGCNIFIPSDLKVVGPNVDEEAVLEYVEVVLRRAQVAGLTLITWGSGGSRRVPEGFDRVTATAQFIYMAKRVAEVAARYDMLLVLENLNSSECNFITSIPEALAVVRAVDHPNFRLCVDIYHMLKDGQPASDIVGTGPYAAYCEIAERDGRTPPGVQGTDFTPYLAAMKAEGYTGKIMIEARWDDLATQGPAAYRTLRDQIDAVYQ
ncbi:sugar phosphate isomerase/epimerase family protein [Neolewinella litorea]|uniref:Sugar phosphate isomerase/epimerase n=1 Tax=Neolewinella litorea TaxID=2562452 RepID=A0A4S4N658_9BACT|nr:sugar phosphate isomerase/epimerase family protein [Neolewinella litorea]THH34604.1 sugar phosphate isomerase/epimerase [Neolewinella litorea]